jgi:DNA-binding beta-propeller fold protein YncE
MLVLDNITGALVETSYVNTGVPLSTSGPWGGLAIDPSGQYLYVGPNGRGYILEYAVNATTGQLNLLGNVPSLYDPISIAVTGSSKP